MTKRAALPLVLSIVAFVVILLAESIRMRTGERPLPIAWSASMIVLVAAIILRWWAVDEARFKAAVQTTNPLPDAALQPRRTLNMMVVSMAVGLAATIVIPQNFFLGAGIYLIMQICLITAYSGILHLHPRKILHSPELRRSSLVTSLLWLTITPLIYILFVYNGTLTLLVAPYVAALGLMAAVVYLGLAYRERPLAFRVLAALGATSFVFSDAIIGHMVFVDPETPLIFLISPTYVLAIILLSQAALFWPEVLRSEVLRK
ncbi:MAG: lysoplasmalogenase family protein [Chloroflexota bacterium]